MLYRPEFLYNVDEPQNGTPSPDTQQEQNAETQGSGEKMLSQSDVDRLIGNTRKEARSKAQSEILTELGLSDLDSLKALVQAQKAKEDAEKSELQKLQEALEVERKQRESIEQSLAKAEQARRETLRDTELLSLLQDARNAKQVLILLQAERRKDIESLLAEDGTFNKETAEKLVSEWRKANPLYFKDGTSLGSPSNAGGKPPIPNREANEQLQKEISRKFQF